MFMELVTLFGAVIAAIAASINLWKSFKDENDSIYVKTGTYRPIATPAAALYIVNTGKYPVIITDYGFVLEDGKLFSIPVQGYLFSKPISAQEFSEQFLLSNLV